MDWRYIEKNTVSYDFPKSYDTAPYRLRIPQRNLNEMDVASQ